MITYKSLEKEYGCQISGKIKKMLGDKINHVFCQTMLEKALKYELTDKDHRIIFNRGSQGSPDFPGLYYLCFIYIHPLTIAQSCLNLASKILKE